MKAIELTETGGPEVMRLREIPTLKPQQAEVLIRVAVTGGRRLAARHDCSLPFALGLPY